MSELNTGNSARRFISATYSGDSHQVKAGIVWVEIDGAVSKRIGISEACQLAGDAWVNAVLDLCAHNLFGKVGGNKHRHVEARFALPDRAKP